MISESRRKSNREAYRRWAKKPGNLEKKAELARVKYHLRKQGECK